MFSDLFKGRELSLNDFKNGKFPIKATKGESHCLVIARVTCVANGQFKSENTNSYKLFQISPIALAQVKVRNVSENLLN